MHTHGNKNPCFPIREEQAIGARDATDGLTYSRDLI